MKKITYLLATLLFAGALSADANPVSICVARTVATSFYRQHFSAATPDLNLAYTENDNDGQPVFYVFDVNPFPPKGNEGNGFIIVSAEDAAQPIIGYSNKGHYVIPPSGNNVGFWMENRKNLIAAIRTQHVTATADITSEWNAYTNNTSYKRPDRLTTSVNPLVQTTWDQPAPYNAYCPGGSVTGCVATAMAQILRYWQYPAHGIGSSCYSDEQSNGFQNNYGTLCAYYDTSNYVWSAMPLSVTSTNNEVAKLMYDCGVSVDMDYSPSGSGAWVIYQDDSICAENSYIKYFGYNPATISGILYASYTPSAWTTIIENEINNHRPVQYVGNDPNNGGHTWVCDGYDADNNLHMNWGWSGADDGYYAVNNLNPGTYDFSQDIEALIGIEPNATVAVFNATPVTGCPSLTVTFTDMSMGNTPITGWNWSFPGGNPSSSKVKNPTVTYNTPGTYNVTEIVTSSSGNDTLVKTAYIDVTGTNPLPLVQGFEGGVFPPPQWTINNPNDDATTWAIYPANVGGYGKSAHSIFYNNCGGGVTGEYDQIYTPLYDFTGVTKPVLYFDVAYAPYNTQYSDTLAIYYSTDCGQTFTRVYLKGGMTLCTTGGLTAQPGGGAHVDSYGCFVPLSNNWRTDTIKIPAIAGKSSVLFSFENRSGNGTNMFLDNINIPANISTSIDAVPANTTVKVYPNPSTGQFTIESSVVSGQWSVDVYNLLGQEVHHSILTMDKTQINLGAQAKGLYIYRIYSETGAPVSIGKLVVQ